MVKKTQPAPALSSPTQLNTSWPPFLTYFSYLLAHFIFLYLASLSACFSTRASLHALSFILLCSSPQAPSLALSHLLLCFSPRASLRELRWSLSTGMNSKDCSADATSSALSTKGASSDEASPVLHGTVSTATFWTVKRRIFFTQSWDVVLLKAVVMAGAHISPYPEIQARFTEAFLHYIAASGTLTFASNQAVIWKTHNNLFTKIISDLREGGEENHVLCKRKRLL